MKKLYFPLMICFSLILTACNLSGEERLKQTLSSEQAPTGVVFEVASDDGEGLKWVVPMVKSYSRQLREKFPGIKFALVSHGKEQFQLTQNNIQRYVNSHRQVKTLVNEEGVTFHICATNAASSGLKANDFVTFVDVVEYAPDQIEKYKAKGYVVLFLKKPE